MEAFIIPAVTMVLTYILLNVTSKIPRAWINPIVLPAMGLMVNFLLMQAGMDGVDPTVAALLGAAASALQKTIEHIDEAIIFKRVMKKEIPKANPNMVSKLRQLKW